MGRMARLALQGLQVQLGLLVNLAPLPILVQLARQVPLDFQGPQVLLAALERRERRQRSLVRRVLLGPLARQVQVAQQVQAALQAPQDPREPLVLRRRSQVQRARLGPLVRLVRLDLQVQLVPLVLPATQAAQECQV